MLFRAAVLVGLAVTAVGQDNSRNVPSSMAYKDFFRQIMQASQPARPPSDVVLLNGEPAAGTVLVRSPGEVLGISEAQMQRLNEIALDCLDKLDGLDRAGVGLTMNARLERIAREMGESDSTTIAEQRAEELEMRKTQVLEDEIGKLKDELGTERFQTLNERLRAGKQVIPTAGSGRAAPKMAK